MKTLISTLAIVALLAGCASAPPASQPIAAVPAAAPVKQSLATITHGDLKAAADYATAHGYPARAAMWIAFDTQLTAAEAQVAACKAAIEASLPQRQPSGMVGAFTLIEMGAEAVATGVPASVKANCEPIVLPSGLLPFPIKP